MGSYQSKPIVPHFEDCIIHINNSVTFASGCWIYGNGNTIVGSRNNIIGDDNKAFPNNRFEGSNNQQIHGISNKESEDQEDVFVQIDVAGKKVYINITYHYVLVNNVRYEIPEDQKILFMGHSISFIDRKTGKDVNSIYLYL